MSNWSRIAIISSGALTVIFAWRLWRRARQNTYELVGHVSSLVVYPVKSCAGIYLDEAECTELGIKYDRSWVIVKGNKKTFVSQRQEPSLALVKPHFKDGYLYLSAPGMISDLKLDPNIQSDERENIDVFGSSGEGVFAGEEAANWISEYLKKPEMMIYYMNPRSRARQIWDFKSLRHLTRTTDESGFTDFSAYMVLGEASLQDLNTRVKSPKTLKNFRPNVIVKDCNAYDEDNWKQMCIGDAQFTGLNNCTRCVLTAVDPETGAVDKTYDALKTLRSYRLHSDRKLFGDCPCFGYYFGIDKIGVIKVGDPIYAIKKCTYFW